MSNIVFNATDPIAILISKLNLLSSSENTTAESLYQLQLVVQTIQDNLIGDDLTKLLSFPSVADMVSDVALTDGNKCYCAGHITAYDGDFRYYYIVDNDTLVPNGDTVLAIDAGTSLRAVYVPSNVDFGDLETQVQQNTTDIAKNKTDITSNKTSITNLTNITNSHTSSIGTINTEIADLYEKVGDGPTEMDPDNLTKPVPINKGGTNASTESAARTNLKLQDGIGRFDLVLSAGQSFSYSTTPITSDSGTTNYFYYYNMPTNNTNFCKPVQTLSSSTKLIIMLDETRYTSRSDYENACKEAENIVGFDTQSNNIQAYCRTEAYVLKFTLYFYALRLFD